MEHLAEAAFSFALWLGLVLIAAKLGAEVSERVFGQPAVVGELIAGVIIGPFALGGIDLPVVGALFATAEGASTAVPENLWVFGQVAAVVLLFVAGLETDLTSFRRYGLAATAVAVGGVVIPFVLGDLAAVAFGLADDPFDAQALFMGVVLTATSLGVTARLLSDLGRLDTPEGVTILGAAVIDDVLGVIVLGLVVAVSASGTVDPLEVGFLGVRTVVLWLALTGLLVAIAALVARAIDRFDTAGAIVSLSFALALLAGVVAESIGLAMIIGAYSAGLALSRSSLRQRLLGDLRIIELVLVPVFFVTMGMLVDVAAIMPVLGLGLVLTLLAAIGKIVGGGLPALLTGFNVTGSLRIGIGMMPRGEVALIVAGIGLGAGVISDAVFGIAVLVAIATTVATPLLLKPAFRDGRSGLRDAPAPSVREERVRVDLPAGLAETFEQQLLDTLEDAGFEQGVSWDDLHGARGVELQREQDLVALESRAGAQDQRSVTLESEAPIADLDDLVRAASEASATHASETLMAAPRFQGT